MSLFKKIGKGLKKATKAVGKGIGNAAKFTAKNPLKVLAPIAGVAGVLMTGGALAPALAGKLAATKVGGTLFGKMISKTMKTGTIVRGEIQSTLKKLGKKSDKKEVDLVEQGLQAEIEKKLGYKLPVDKKASTAEQAMQKLKALSGYLTEQNLNADDSIRQTIDAERQVLIDNPDTNGILSKDQLPEDVWNQMTNAGSIKQNVLGTGVDLLGGLLGTNPTKIEKAKDALNILTGNSNDPYLAEDMQIGTEVIEAKLNESSMLPASIGKFFKMPIVWLIGGAIALYFIFSNNKKRRR